MVSQRSMHRTTALRSWLLGLSAILLAVPGCGQDEGERCQVDSDCASGLVCVQGETGNGQCRKRGAAGTTDAGPDVATDAPVDAPVSGPETPLSPADAPADARTDVADAPSPGLDTQPVALDTGHDVPVIDLASPAVDAASPSLDVAIAADLPAPLDGGPAIDAGAIDVRGID